MKQPVKSVLLKYYYAILALALHPLFLSPVCAICQLDVKHFMFQLGLFSTRRLDYFSLAVLNNSLLCSVSSVPSTFLVLNNSSKISRVTVQMSCRLNFYIIEDKELCLETRYLAISSIPLFSVAESFLWRYHMCTPTYIIDCCYFWSVRAAHAK